MYVSVGDGRKVVIPKADGVKGAGLKRTENLVDRGGEEGAGLRRADGDGDGQAGGVLPAQSEDRDAHRVAGRDAVVDEHEMTTGNFRRGAPSAIEDFASLEFEGFVADDFLKSLGAEAGVGDQSVVEQSAAAGGDRAHGGFGRAGQPEFTHHENVEGSAEGAGEFPAHGNAAARQRENKWVGAVKIFRDEPREGVAGFRTVAISIRGNHPTRVARRAAVATGASGKMRRVKGESPTARCGSAPFLRDGTASRLTTMKTIHVAEIIAQGGRDGTVEAPEGGFSARLSTDEKPGSVTPEHLFAGAYAACFLGALKSAAEKAHQKTEGMTLVARAHLDEDDTGGWKLNVELRAAMPGLGENEGLRLMRLAHQTCPYSKATRGNIQVALEFD